MPGQLAGIRTCPDYRGGRWIFRPNQRNDCALQGVAGGGAAREAGLSFVRHEKNKGKAAAIHTALSAATQELCVIHDADLEYHPGDLAKMVEVFLAEPADAVFGSRFLAGEYRRVLFFRHELGNKFLTLLCNVVSDLNLSDMETCYKMVRTSLLKSIPLMGQGFEIEPEITIKLAKRGARIFEVPIRYAGRTYQEGKKIGWRDGLGAIGAIFRYSWSDQIYVEDTYGSQILGRLNRAPRFTQWMADVIRPYVGRKCWRSEPGPAISPHS